MAGHRARRGGVWIVQLPIAERGTYRDGRLSTVELWDDKTILQKTPFSIARSLKKTRLFASSKKGEPQRAFRADKDELWVSGRNFPAGATFDVYLVARQFDWRELAVRSRAVGTRQCAPAPTPTP